MGNLETQKNTESLLSEFTELRKENNGTVLSDKKGENTYFLKEFNFVNKKEFEAEFKRLQNLESQPQNENILPLTRLFSQTFNNICSNSFRIYALYEYPAITLQEEILARRKEGKYFDETQLWSILQSCAYALNELKPTVSVHPKSVFIVPDGVLKLINNEMIDEDYRCFIKDYVYYAPEKIRQFKKTDSEGNIRKQAIFSLGMTLLHAAILEPINDCYNYSSCEFLQDKLQAHIQELVTRKDLGSSQVSSNGQYSEQFVEMLAMILEPNPNKRASLMEVHGMLNKVWNTETEEDAKNQQQQHVDEVQQQHNHSISSTISKKMIQKDVQPQVQVPANPENYQSFKKPIEKQIISSKISLSQSNPQSERQSKPYLNINEYNSTNSIMNGQFYIESMKSSVQYQPYCGSNYIPSSIPQNNKENALYTDPKLLQMIRKDLRDLNQLKKSSVMSSVAAPVNYNSTNTYMNSSNFSCYGNNGQYQKTGLMSSKSSVSIHNTSVAQPVTFETVQLSQVHDSVNYQSNQLSQRNQNIPSYKSESAKPTLQKQPNFTKNQNNAVYVVEDYQDGRKFQGTLVNNRKQGHGKLTYADGAYYEGNFHNDQMEGKGTLYYGVDRPAYSGDWMADQFHGHGILYNENPIELNGCFNYNDFNLIEDYWVSYEGNFDVDNKAGEGRLLLSNGEEFQGEFYNDFINGRGVFFTSDGEQIQGVWEDNVLVQLNA